MNKLRQILTILLIVCFNPVTGQDVTSKDRLVIVKDRKYGYIDTTGKIIIEPKWDFAFDFDGNMARVNIGGKPNNLFSVEGGKNGFIDKQGNYVVEPLSLYAFNFECGLSRVYLDGKYGYMDMDGNLVIEPQYTEAFDFNHGIACVGKEMKYGCIDKSGKFLVPLLADNPVMFENGFAITGLMWEKQLMNSKGKIITPETYFDIKPFSDGLAVVISNESSLSGAIDTNGKLVVPFKYGFLNSFKNGFTSANIGGTPSDDKIRNGEWVIIDKSERIISTVDAEMMKPLSEGCFAVLNGLGWGFVDLTGKVVAPCSFRAVSDFSNGMAKVKVADSWGYIDKTGTMVIKPAFDKADDFKNGCAIVNVGYFNSPYYPENNKPGKYGVINKAGKYVIPLQYDAIQWETATILKVTLGTKTGYFTKEGVCIFPLSE